MNHQWILTTTFPFEGREIQVIVCSDGIVSHGYNERNGRHVVLENCTPKEMKAIQCKNGLWWI